MTATMKDVARLSMILLVAWAVVLPKFSQGQAAGNKGVYNSSPAVAASQVWIDASAFWTSGTTPDLCSIISGSILNSSYSGNYPNGAVIDARGLYYNSSSAASIGCSGTPFANFTTSSPPPTTILLPAATIPVSQTWVLPNNVKIVGENQRTVLSASVSSSWTSGTDVVDMGSSGLCSTPCSGIAIEHLHIDTSNYSKLNGIVNNYAELGSYVNDVEVTANRCAGLTIGSGSATNSGPYTNINFVATGPPSSCFAASGGGGSNLSYPLCIDIETQTRGVHGATCIGYSSVAKDAAIYVNASNNTIEDIHFENFWDGIQIGDVASTVGNIVVSNVTGADNGAQPQNIVHICGSNPAASGAGGAACTTSGTVMDISIFQSTYVNGLSGTSTSIQDDVTGTSIPSPQYGTGLSGYPGSLAGAYLLGEGIGGGDGFSRFNVSPSAISTGTGTPPTAPTWGVGIGVTTGATCTTPGTLYSSTAGGSLTSVYVCTSSFQWEPIA
jgi:hypothetical protein